MKRLQTSWALTALIVACTEEPLTTIDARCGHGEATFELATYAADRDVIVVIDREQARAVEPRLRALVSALITGAVDDGGERVLRHDQSIRLSIATPAQLADNSSTGTPLPFLRYQNAPYGYADDLEAFLDRLPCLYGPMPASCAEADSELAPGIAYADFILVGTDESNEGTIALIASSVYEYEGRIAQVAIEAPDYRPALFELTDCSHAYPHDAVPLEVESFKVEADGRFACRLFETLPATGPITRCSQLERYGRRLHETASNEGRETCEVEQVLPRDADTSHGWLIPFENDYRISWPEGEPRMGCVEARLMTARVPTFSWPSQPISGASFKMRCVLAADSNRPSCEDL